MVYVWANSDVKKLAMAKLNKLNYVVLYSKKDVLNFIQNLNSIIEEKY